MRSGLNVAACLPAPNTVSRDWSVDGRGSQDSSSDSLLVAMEMPAPKARTYVLLSDTDGNAMEEQGEDHIPETQWRRSHPCQTAELTRHEYTSVG